MVVEIIVVLVVIVIVVRVFGICVDSGKQWQRERKRRQEIQLRRSGLPERLEKFFQLVHEGNYASLPFEEGDYGDLTNPREIHELGILNIGIGTDWAEIYTQLDRKCEKYETLEQHLPKEIKKLTKQIAHLQEQLAFKTKQLAKLTPKLGYAVPMRTVLNSLVLFQSQVIESFTSKINPCRWEFTFQDVVVFLCTIGLSEFVPKFKRFDFSKVNLIRVCKSSKELIKRFGMNQRQQARFRYEATMLMSSCFKDDGHLRDCPVCSIDTPLELKELMKEYRIEVDTTPVDDLLLTGPTFLFVDFAQVFNVQPRSPNHKAYNKLKQAHQCLL